MHCCKIAEAIEIVEMIFLHARLRQVASPGTMLAFRRMHGCAMRSPKGEAWWAWEDLNFRPHAYQARALTN